MYHILLLNIIPVHLHRHFSFYDLVGILFTVTITFWIAIELIRKRSWSSKFKARHFDDRLTVHMVSETEYVTQGQGVHTAYIEMLQLLNEQPDIELVTNNRGRGNVFHSHTYGPYYFFKGIGYKGRRILTAHVIPESSRGTIPFWRQLFPLTSFYLKMAYAYADVVIAISPTVERSIKALGVTSKIVRIYNPVLKENWIKTAQKRAEGRKLLGISDSEQVVLGVGQLQERKGVEDFIDMAVAMPNKRFVWVGGRPWGVFTEGVGRIDARIQNAPLNMIFTGLKDLQEMPDMYAAADLFIFPSYQENCPLAPLEAATAGLPVIFRDIPEYESLFSEPYLKASTTANFVLLANKLLKDPEFYQKGVTLSGNIIKKFDKDEIRKQLIELYQDVFINYYSRNEQTKKRDQFTIN